MASGENLIQQSRPSGQEWTTYSTTSQFKLRMYSHPIITELCKKQARQVLSDVPNTLSFDQVGETIYKFLSQTEKLGETIKSIFGYEPEINGMKTMIVNMDRKAYILLNEIDTSAGKGCFATYISRNPNGTELGNEAERDFHNLRELSDAAEEKLDGKARKQYKFMKPISLFDKVEMNGHEYSSFTMPFINDYGELRVDQFQSASTPLQFPYFRYSVPSNNAMKAQNEDQHAKAKAIERKFQKFYSGHGSKEATLMKVTQSPESQAIQNQVEDLAVGNALIYLLSNGHFPKDFMVNTGDWMVNFLNEELYLQLITVRGGWEYIGNEDAWINRMTKQSEVIPGREMRDGGIPLFYNQEELLASALKKAKQMMR